MLPWLRRSCSKMGAVLQFRGIFGGLFGFPTLHPQIGRKVMALEKRPVDGRSVGGDLVQDGRRGLQTQALDFGMAEGDAVSVGSVEGKQQPHFHSYLWEKVEKQRIDGKYRYLVKEVISSPEVLSAAYEKIRLGSNLASQCGKNELAFDGVGPKWYHWVGGQLVQGTLDVKALCHQLSSHKDRESSLILPSLHLKIIQMALKMVLEVIFEPRFSAISHGCRAGRGRHTAM
eukprot:c955_g1_i1 orf=3-689(-)